MSECVRLEMRETIGILTIDVAKTRNALSGDVLHALAAHLEALGGSVECRAIVLTGAGGHFCSGGDISGMSAQRTLAVSRERAKLGQRVARLIVGGTKPVIAAVEGYAAGAGLSLAAASDYHVASTSAKFVASFCKAGLIPDFGLLWTLPSRIGPGEAKRMFASARTVEAAEGARLGLVDMLVPSGQALAAAVEVARSFTTTAPLPLAIVKAAYASGCSTFEDALRYELDNFSALQLTHDHREAVAAFLEKRIPVFRGT